MRILMVIDAQNDFITGALGNKECEATVPKIVETIRSGKYDMVFLTMDTHDENYMNTQEGKKLPVPHCIRNTEGWQINDDVMDAVSKSFKSTKIFIVEKPTFGSIDLVSKYKNIQMMFGTDVEIDYVGFCTGICVLSNVTIAKAALPEAKICVIEDACACVTPKTHQTAIEAMKLIQIDMLQTKDL